ncbi:MAG: TonB-dependent receptor plug domain-containing protein [Proteobacteria bacterium]|nr:TonB-dependent receptor plug domain-containing protein [Pseudomonadota bacterium]
MKTVTAILILGMIICPGGRWFLLAQETEKVDIWKLDEIVVTGTRTPHLLKDVPVETIVVTQEEIKRSSAEMVSDLLKEIPGVYIRGENFPGASAYQSQMRGLPFDSGYGLIFIDGQRVLGGGMGENRD